MTIPGLIQRSKALLGRVPTDVLVIAVFLGSISASFGLGYITGKDRAISENGPDVTFEQFKAPAVPIGGGPAAVGAAPVQAAKATTGTYMASKNGTKYYLPTCSSSNRIKPENRVWFATKAEAEAAGYGPASNCPGL